MAKGWLFLGRNKQSKTEAVNVDNGALEVKTVGNIAALQSMNLADRPIYTTITGPTSFTLLNTTLDTWVTDGSADWVEV